MNDVGEVIFDSSGVAAVLPGILVIRLIVGIKHGKKSYSFTLQAQLACHLVGNNGIDAKSRE